MTTKRPGSSGKKPGDGSGKKSGGKSEESGSDSGKIEKKSGGVTGSGNRSDKPKPGTGDNGPNRKG